MRLSPRFMPAALLFAAATLVHAQPPIRIYQPPQLQEQQQQQPQAQPNQQQPGQAQPGQQNAAAPVRTAPPPGQTPRLSGNRGFLMGGVSLKEMIDLLAQMLKINY